MRGLCISSRVRRSALLLATLGLASLAGSAGAAVVFSDTFGSSVINASTYPTITSSSTAYQIASTKNQSPAASIAAGHLKLGMAATTSGFNEAQARFASSPQQLTTAGDFIDYTMTFTDTTGLLGGGTNSLLAMGLYNSGGVNPVSGLQSSGLNTTASSTFATGGTQLWQGYAARINGTGGNNITFTRPQQNTANDAAGTSENQDLLGNNAGGGLYKNPAGAQVGSGVVSAVTLTNGSVYTMDMKITLNADGSETIATNMYSGADTSGTNLATSSVTTGITPLTTSFDGLAFGWRQSGTSIATGIDVNSITINTGSVATTPEPASLGVLCLGGVALIRRRVRA